MISYESLFDNYIIKNKTMENLCPIYNVSVGTIYKYLKKWNIRKLYKHDFKKNIFSEYTPESCYWAGFIAADGNVSNDRLTISLKKEDIGHLKNFCYFLESDCNIEIKNDIGGYSKTECNRVRFNSVQMIKDLYNNFNIIPNKSLILQPPNNIPKQLINHFVRGFMDGDGCISWCRSNKSPELSFITGSYSILDWIKNYIRVNNNVGNPSILKRKNSNCFSLKFGGSQVHIILDWIYKNSKFNSRLNRKFERFIEYKNRKIK